MPQNVCLTMIVKNEAHVIERCLQSARPFIDSWCIVDTGSTDETPALIQRLLKEIPGELHHSTWKDFGTNRTEAIELALDRADYLLFLDADEIFELPSGFDRPELTADAYSLEMRHGDTLYWREVLVNTRIRWRYEGVLHEYLTADEPYSRARLTGPSIVGMYDGGRSQGQSTIEKYRRDATTLEAALEKEPNNARYVFYLAQSYRDCGENAKGLAAYLRRAAMGGWDEEVWYSLFQAARLRQAVGHSSPTVVEAYLKAYQFRPARAEPLVYLAAYHRERQEHALAHLYAQQAVRISAPDDMLFLDRSCYVWRGLDEYAVSCYYVGEYRESARSCKELLDGEDLPQSERERVRANLALAEAALGASA